jgi:hypothetical protein
MMVEDIDDLFHEMVSQVRMNWHYNSGDMMEEGISDLFLEMASQVRMCASVAAMCMVTRP